MNFVAMEPINKGWSGDKKYCATDVNGTRYYMIEGKVARGMLNIKWSRLCIC